MTEKTYAVGIDFGTSNSAISLSRPEDDAISSLEITQVASPGTLEERRVLPSAIYINAEGEFNPGTLAVPWSEDKNPSTVTGSFARERGSQVPERLVSSAKSWLCNDHVNRRDAILPWRSQIGEEKISPFGAAIQILDHIRSSLLYNSPDDFELAKAKVVLTVPASFDEVARALTFNASIAAGFGEVTLLEEPQAAFYSWLAERKDKWSEEVTPDDVILVCDVGGGTADFSLITVTTENGILGLERISVGEHILLGGDNMDLALAIALKQQFSSEGKEIDEWQFQSLVHASRMAKEKLFSEPDISELNISVAGRGSSLFSQSLSTRLTREMMESVILDGFVPETEISEMPVDRKDSALQEFGLPYAADPVLSKHLASFLVESLGNVRSDPKLSKLMESKLNLKDANCIIPTAILFNGGVFKADAIRKRGASIN
jgi:molecular chaperone DnaK (HSP70)